MSQDKNVIRYFCSCAGRIDSLLFTRRHAAEIEGRDPADYKNKPCALTRADALELVNKWNSTSADGAKYYIRALEGWQA